MAYQIVIVAFASYLTWFWLIASYPAGKLAAFSFLTPLFGLVAGGVLLGERISAAMVAAMLLVCFGIYLVNRRPAVSLKPASPCQRKPGLLGSSQSKGLMHQGEAA